MSDQVLPYTVRPEALPAELRELVRVLGAADAFRLIGQAGGSRMRLPKHPSADHPLRLVVSKEGFEVLIAHYGGEHLELPKGDAYLRELRHDHVRQCRLQGMTVDDTAEATGYSRRHVINILGGHGAYVDTATMDLFADMDEPAENQAGTANNPFGIDSRRT